MSVNQTNKVVIKIGKLKEINKIDSNTKKCGNCTNYTWNYDGNVKKGCCDYKNNLNAQTYAENCTSFLNNEDENLNLIEILIVK